MAERPRPNLDEVREVMREHDARQEDEPREPAPEDDRPDRPDDDSDES